MNPFAVPGPEVANRISTAIADAAQNWAEQLSRIASLSHVASCRVVHLTFDHTDTICASGEPWPATWDAVQPWAPPDIANADASAPLYLAFPLTWPDGALFGTLDILRRDDADGDLFAQMEIAQSVIEDDLALVSLALNESGPDMSAMLEHERIMLQAASGQIGLWDYDIAGDCLQCDTTWYALLGVDGRAQPIDSVGAYRSFIHPLDAAAATDIDHAVLRGLIKAAGDYDITYRIVRPGGAVRWVRSMARLIEDPAGNAVRATGAMFDVTGGGLGMRTVEQARQLIRRAETLARQAKWMLERPGLQGTERPAA